MPTRNTNALTGEQRCIDTVGPAAMLYATLYALEERRGLIPAGSKPDPLNNPSQREIAAAETGSTR